MLKSREIDMKGLISKCLSLLNQPLVSVLRSRMLNLNIIVNNFFYVINCWNINHVKIYKAKFLGIITLKGLPTDFFSYYSELKSTKFRFRRLSLTELIRASLCKLYVKTFRGFRESGKFLKICLSIFLERFKHLFQSQYFLMVWWWL